jgi:hypothetical protein
MPGLGRIDKIPEEIENRLYYDFIGYGGHLLPPNRNTWDVIFLMQHHGVPTRLLDWTENFSVALYFALKDSKLNKSAAIWLLDPYSLNISSCDLDEIDYLESSYPEGYVKYFLDDDFKKLQANFPKTVVAIQANPPNARIVAQKGAFTIHNNLEKPLEELFPECLKKIVIEPDLFKAARKFLTMSGISEFTLFPDLDGLARHIKNLELKIKIP